MDRKRLFVSSGSYMDCNSSKNKTHKIKNKIIITKYSFT